MSRPFKLTPPITPEHEMQIDVARMLNRILLPDVCWSAVDHANAADATTGAIRKARGAKPGLPDLLFWYQGRAYAIELKIVGGVVSPAQRQFQDQLARAGGLVAVCRDCASVFSTVQAWGLSRARMMT